MAGAFDGHALVGAATGTLMEDHADEFAEAFADRDLAAATIFYCAKSVLRPAYRGHRFFDLRESDARLPWDATGWPFAPCCARPTTAL